MPEDPRPPVAIRITRPYGNEDEFLEHELDTLTRTSVTLLGAQPRPQGVVLRFELVLSTGQAILRGEGRVVGFKPDVLHGLGGLTLRFTRLDSRSKALVDKAAAARERRRPSHAPPASDPPKAQPAPEPPPASAPPPPPVYQSDPDLVPAAPVSVEVIAVAPVSSPSEPPPPVSARPRSIPPPLPPRALRQNALKLEPTPPPSRVGKAGTLQPPAHRDELLERLRARAKQLDPAEVQRILSQRKRA
ncbi:MAG TPA: hypothetical protein VF765_27070 [Polyangiaceae bacterium]